ncbi:MAG: pyridoxamine 5'-phosphate oxidase family protein [Spirochaetales bacterium]|nr:pyridoxamine 5'-phosphate oxidase family protein [Spirochaetales bacterium]
MEGVERVYQFLNEVGTYYLATVDGDQPRVRAFGTVLLCHGRIYIQTGKVKAVSRQIAANPKVELCAFKGGEWLRLSGRLVNDDNREVKVAMLEKMPSLKGMYSADDDNMQMLYFTDAEATFSSFTSEPETVRF